MSARVHVLPLDLDKTRGIVITFFVCLRTFPCVHDKLTTLFMNHQHFIDNSIISDVIQGVSFIAE